MLQGNYDIDFRNNCEEAILGSLLIDNSDELKSLVLKHNLLPSDFHDIHCNQLYTAILDAWKDEVKVDLLTVTNYRPSEYRGNVLESSSITWDYQNVQLSQKVSSTAHVEHHILMLKQFVLMDYWNNVGGFLNQVNWSERDVLEVGDNAIKKWQDLIKRMTDGVKQNVGEIGYEEEMTRKYLDNLAGISTSITTGTVETDDMLEGGLTHGELIFLAGRPGSMKTTIALIMAWKSARQGTKVDFYSLEMSRNQLINKIVSMETGINYFRIKRGELNTEEFSQVLSMAKMVENSNLTIFREYKHIDAVTANIDERCAQGLCQFAIIDYLQRMDYDQKEPRHGITYITRNLKTCANDNYIPLMCLSQLSRAVENRLNKRPILADLKESSSIEEDADIVLFPYRHAYYQDQIKEPYDIREKWKVEFNIGKGRDIGTESDVILDINPIHMTLRAWSQLPQGPF